MRMSTRALNNCSIMVGKDLLNGNIRAHFITSQITSAILTSNTRFIRNADLRYLNVRNALRPDHGTYKYRELSSRKVSMFPPQAQSWII